MQGKEVRRLPPFDPKGNVVKTKINKVNEMILLHFAPHVSSPLHHVGGWAYRVLVLLPIGVGGCYAAVVVSVVSVGVAWSCCVSCINQRCKFTFTFLLGPRGVHTHTHIHTLPFIFDC